MNLKRPDTQKLQTESFIAIRDVINQMNCEFRETVPDNAGLDGEIDLVKNQFFKGKLIKCQIKAGDSYISSETKSFIKVRLEKKYLDLWAESNFPVILFFYKPETKSIYWKAIKEYLKIEPSLCKKLSNTVTISFDKKRDNLSIEVLEKWFEIVEGKFEYEKIIYSVKEREIIWSNWYPVLEFPKFVFSAPTTHGSASEISHQLKKFYSFIIKNKQLYTFSNLENSECELNGFCDTSMAEKQSIGSVAQNYLIELLNIVLKVNLLKKELIQEGARFCFDPKCLSTSEGSYFSYTPIKRKTPESRAKIYRTNEDNLPELKHHAIKANFHVIGSNWFLELEPDFYFSYPRGPYKSAKEIGIRITKEKAGMFNANYRYHLHAMKQYIANDQTTINFPCDELDDAQSVIIDGKCLSYESNFMLYNDYNGPEYEDDETDED